MKKATLIETLKAMHDNAHSCIKIWKDEGDEIMMKKATSEWVALDMVIRMMENDAFANEIRNIYFTKEGVRK